MKLHKIGIAYCNLTLNCVRHLQSIPYLSQGKLINVLLNSCCNLIASRFPHYVNLSLQKQFGVKPHPSNMKYLTNLVWLLMIL